MIIYTFSDRILSLNKINITKLLPEILKILKLDDNNSLAVLEHPTGSENVGEMFGLDFYERERDRWIIFQGDRDSEAADY